MANQYLYDLTDTWNNVATTFDAIKMNVTDTTSAAASKLLNLQVGGSAKFTVQKDGAVALTGAVTGATSITASGTVTADLLTVTKTTANAAAITSTGYSLTGSNATSLVDLAGTWNTTGNPAAIKLNVTNTASGSTSLLMDLQVGGSSLFSVTKAGAVSLPAGTAAAPSIRSSASTGTGIYFSGNNLLFSADGANRMGLDGLHNITVSAISVLQWANSGGGIGGTVDLIALRDASATLAIRNGTNAQTFRVYNTSSSSNANYERGKLEWSSDIFRIGTEKGGTGTNARAMHLQTDGTTALTLTTAQKAEFAATIKTAAPAGGTAAEWKLGTVASVTPTSPNRTIEVDIGGTIYYVHAKTTND